MKYQLRDYQQKAVDETYAYWRTKKGINPLIVAPTGSGKSLIIAQIIADVMKYEDNKVMVLSHVKELLTQNAEKIINIAPELLSDIGFYSAGLNQKKMNRPITFAGIQSIWKKAYNLIPAPDVVIIDEAHLMPKNITTRYGKFIDDLKQCNPKLKIVGLTATHYRMDSGLLHEGKGAIFDGVSFDISITELMERGYLAPVTCKAGHHVIDTTGIKTVAGEFNQRELAVAANDEQLIKDTVAEITKLGHDRKSWLVFSQGVDHGNKLAAGLREHGTDVVTVFGDDTNAAREVAIADFKEGRVRCMVNCGVLTTGFDAPAVDMIAIVRATQSCVLYVQIIGRGTRISPETGKTDCLILDFGGNVERHGFIDKIRPKSKAEKSDEKEPAPVRACPECEFIMGISERVCPVCGYEFPAPEFNHDSFAYSGAILSTEVDEVEPEFSIVDRVTYYRHQKQGKPDSIRVTYKCGLNSLSEWLCPDHGGYAAGIYQGRKYNLGATADTTDVALLECKGWNKPRSIKHVPDGNFTRIIKVYYHSPNDEIDMGSIIEDEIPDFLDSDIPF